MSRVRSYDHNKYANIALVAGLMDLHLMADLTFESPMIHPEFGYSIGTDGDPEAGLFPIRWTPYFKTIDELEAFCLRHIEKYNDISSLNEPPEGEFWKSWEDPVFKHDYRQMHTVGCVVNSGHVERKIELIHLLERVVDLAGHDTLQLYVDGQPFPKMLYGIMGHLQRSLDSAKEKEKRAV
jgi:hypothetical protein